MSDVSWFKLDDQFADHPKVLAVGGDAGWLFVCAGLYAARHLTDGKIPKAAVPRLTDRARPERLAQLLVGAGLWHDEGDHFRIHDFLDYNPSREQVETERRRRSEAGAKGAAQRWGSKSDGTGDGTSHDGSDGTPDGLATGSSDAPGPSRPGTPPATSSRPPRRRGTRIPDTFIVTEEMQEWAATECPGVDWEFETRRFVDWAKSASGPNAVKVDWPRAWKNWIRKEFKEKRR